MKLLAKVNTILDRTAGFLALLAAVLIVFIMLSITAEVSIARLLFNRPQAWVVDLSEYSLLFITFLGAAWVLKRDGHVKMDLVLTQLKPRAQLVMSIITSIIGTIICLALTWYGTRTTWNAFQLGLRTATVMELPRGPIFAVIPVGSFLLFVQYLKITYGYLRRWKEPTQERLKVVKVSG